MMEVALGTRGWQYWSMGIPEEMSMGGWEVGRGAVSCHRNVETVTREVSHKVPELPESALELMKKLPQGLCTTR